MIDYLRKEFVKVSKEREGIMIKLRINTRKYNKIIEQIERLSK